mgnify:CR=1 FL=1
MPLDGILEDNNFVNIDDELNFNVVYEPTKFNKKKYVINENTGEYLGVVGNSFSCAPHPVFFKGIGEVIQENRTPHELKDATVISRTAHNNAWSMLDITLPNVTSTITTDKHETTIAERIIALHAVLIKCTLVRLTSFVPMDRYVVSMTRYVERIHLTSVWIDSLMSLKMPSKTSMHSQNVYNIGREVLCLS